MARILGPDALARLAEARVCVVGLGGVGSWTAELLARSGVGSLVLIDGDEVCRSNIHRQIHALPATVGRPKAEVMAERIRAIDPGIEVEAKAVFVRPENRSSVIPDDAVVVDAIDRVTAKCDLLAWLHGAGRTVITCGGAGGRTDSTAITVADLAATDSDRLLAKVRKQLRQRHGFPRRIDVPFGIPCVHSTEPPVERPDVVPGPPCDTGYGSAGWVTAAFGLAAAGWVVRRLTGRFPGGTTPTVP